jgi:hypothetical protein
VRRLVSTGRVLAERAGRPSVGLSSRSPAGLGEFVASAAAGEAARVAQHPKERGARVDGRERRLADIAHDEGREAARAHVARTRDEDHAPPVADRERAGSWRNNESRSGGECRWPTQSGGEQLQVAVEGHVAERIEGRATSVPAWAWTNLLAHESEPEGKLAVRNPGRNGSRTNGGHPSHIGA